MSFLDIAPAMIVVVTIASIIYYYRSELKFLGNAWSLKALSKKFGEEEEEKEEYVNSYFECPRCGRKMEKVTMRDFWRNQMSYLESSLFYRNFYSSPIRQMSLFGTPTYQCKRCGITYFDKFGSISL